MEPENAQKQEEKVSAPGVMEKYQAAGKICNSVMGKLIKTVVAGESLYQLCTQSDKWIAEEVHETYKNKKVEVKNEDGEKKSEPMQKGVAYPTSISVNQICGHHSPCKTDDVVLKAGDLAKINLGVHFDGYMVQLGHTVVVAENSTTPAKADGRKADVMLAAWNGLQTAVRMLKPGNKNNNVTKAIDTACKSYNCEPVQGVLSHEVQRWLIDGDHVIINKETPDQKVAEHEFGVNEIYVVDVYASTGKGIPKESEMRVDIFKREVDANVDLKSKNSRQFLGEVRKKYATFPFAVRCFEDEILARAGSQECIQKGCVTHYPVLTEKEGEYVAQFQWTVLISAKRIICFSQENLDVTTLSSEGSITDADVKALVDTPLADFTSKPKPPPKEKK